MIREETVLQNQLLDPEARIYKLVLKGKVAETARPGQFVHLKVSPTLDPLLRRPISIAGINRQRGEITLYYRVAGRGTELLAGVREKQTLNLIGPLGNGFTMPSGGELLLLAGGIGIFPLFSLLEALDRTKVKLKLLWGAENRRFLQAVGLKTLEQMGVDYEVSTLDGSMGRQGLITALLESYLQERNYTIGTQSLKFPGDTWTKKDWDPTGEERSPLRAVACGPQGMLKAVTAICLQKGVPIEVSLEERMACGVGACLGCVCTVRGADGALARKRVCQDGPVFDGREVVWDEEG